MIGKTNSQTGGVFRGEKLNISLKTNQSSHSDLIGAVITITHAGGTTEHVWGGSEFTVEVPPYVEYSVEYGAVEGYATPAKFAATAVKDNARTLTAEYKTTIVTVNMADNQSSLNDIANATATVAASGITTKTVKTGQSVKVPTGVSCTVTWGALADYKTPSAQTFTTSGTSATKTGTYQTELVSVSLNADNGASVNGAKVTINGKSHTWNGTAITQKVAFGTTYSVSVCALDGFSTPSAQNNISASQASRSLTFTYIASALKVNILSNQGTDAVIAAVKATVKYGSTTLQVNNGQQIGIPTNQEVTITFPSVEGYKTPDTIKFTNTNGGVVEKTGTYQTQLLTVNVTYSGTAPSGYIITGKDSGGNVLFTQSVAFATHKIPYGTSYTVSASKLDGYDAVASQSGIANSTANTITMMYVHNPVKITKIRIDQTITDPEVMITRIIDLGGIEAIRANSHRYTGTFANGKMTLKQLDDANGTKYADGTTATLTKIGTDVWMKLPQFHWKCTEHATDVWDFEVVYGAKPDDTYKTWDGNDLIGAYEAYNSSSNLYSVSGQVSTGSVSQADFKTYARARGEGFTLVKWKHHCMMAMLYYTMYGHTNCQNKIGKGTSDYQKATGVTNSLGMTDTVAGGNGDSNSINFWGLENWWGNKYEWIDNVLVYARAWKVAEDDGTVRQAGTGGSSDDWTSKLLLGENIDLIPTAASGSETTGFCDYYYQSSSNSCVVRRSGSHAYTLGGVAYVSASNASSATSSSIGSRLAFRGECVIA